MMENEKGKIEGKKGDRKDEGPYVMRKNCVKNGRGPEENIQ